MRLSSLDSARQRSPHVPILMGAEFGVAEAVIGLARENLRGGEWPRAKHRNEDVARIQWAGICSQRCFTYTPSSSYDTPCCSWATQPLAAVCFLLAHGMCLRQACSTHPVAAVAASARQPRPDVAASSHQFFEDATAQQA